MEPDGTNARSLTSGDITSLAWSPDHHQLLFRQLAGRTAFPSPTQTSPVPDATAGVLIIGINGGTPLPLTRDDTTTLRSDGWWNPEGNRLIYRQEFSLSPSSVSYVVSQNDQPAGIASKPLLNDASLPVLSSDGHQVAVLDPSGNLRLGAPSSPGMVIAHGGKLMLPGTGRPAHLLWQPRNSAVLYPTAGDSGGTKLVLVGLDGKVHWSLQVPSLLDAAFSPSGSLLLVRTPSAFEVFSVGSSRPLFSWTESDPYAQPWWSPSSDQVLIEDRSGFTLLDIHRRLSEAVAAIHEAGGVGGQAVRNWWVPSVSDPWSPDGGLIVFSASRGDTWGKGKPLPAPQASSRGLYVLSVTGDTLGAPSLVDSAGDTLATWSYPDPSTTFLIGAP